MPIIHNHTMGSGDGMSDTARQCDLGVSALRAVASRAGVILNPWGSPEHDEQCIDYQLVYRYANEHCSTARARADIQVKTCTNMRTLTNNDRSYPVDKRTYAYLKNNSGPCLLVVYDMPNRHNDWLVLTASAIELRNKLYYSDPTTWPEWNGLDSMAIHIPSTNVLSPDKLVELMLEFSK